MSYFRHLASDQEVLIKRRVINTHPSYLEAREIVDYLVSKEIPREKLTIVAEELRFLEDVTGGSAGRTAVQGALTGGGTGLAFGFFFGLFSWVEPVISEAALALYGFLFGAGLGALLGLAAYRFSGDRSTPFDIGHLQAGRYAVLATNDVAEQATRISQAINRPRIVR
jgi:hypothetical protein